jgi:hypothetical protein
MRYSVKVEIKHKKQGLIEFVEDHMEHDTAAASYTLWKALVHSPNTHVACVSFIQHEAEKTLDTAVKGASPKPRHTHISGICMPGCPACPPQKEVSLSQLKSEPAHVNG